MKVRRNKAEVRRNLDGIVDLGRGPSIRQACQPNPGINAGDARSSELASGSWRTAPGQKLTRDPSKGFKARPIDGTFGEPWALPAEALPPLALLRGVEVDHFDGQAAHGAEHRLLQDAGEHAAKLETAKDRDYLRRECKRLTEAGSLRAKAIGEALGF